jgi:D-3-phosphoglycerate dehydrogenase
MSKKVLVATEKPFAPEAVEKIKSACENANYEFRLLESYQEKSEFLAAVKDVNALIIRSDKVTEEVIAASDNLEIVVRAGAGYDNVDLKAASEKNVVVMNTPGQNSNAVAELALGMMVYMARGQFNGKSGTELYGKILGIHAYGNVGKHVARIGRGFGMEVYAYDPFVADEMMLADGVKPLKNVDDLYKMCDYISLHLPFIPQTERFVNYKLIGLMKKGATIINTARKEVVCEDGII